MGQKVNPVGFRRQVITTWPSLWYSDKDSYADDLHGDLKIRRHLLTKYVAAAISDLHIERASASIIISITAVRPGILIGKKGGDLEKLKKELSKLLNYSGEISINVTEMRKPEMSAYLVGQSIAKQLRNRVAFRKAVKKAMQSSMRMGAKGIRVSVSGRLAGAEIARTEWYREGRVPLHTLRAQIDHAVVEAHTTYGVIGVKVWIYKGDHNSERNNRLR